MDNRIDDRCGYSLFKSTPSDFLNKETLKKCSLRQKEYEKSVFCRLPFSNTIEAEAFGAQISVKGNPAVPGIKEFLCNTVDDLFILPDMDFKKEPLQEVLQICRELKEEGFCVLYELSGPLTILSGLIDVTSVFRIMRKDREKMNRIYKKLKKEMTEFAMELVKSGVDIISYADPAGTEKIIGMRLSDQMIQDFTYPFLLELSEKINKRSLIVLCPQITMSLFHAGKICFEEKNTDQELSYGMACKKMIGQESFMGTVCIHNEKIMLKDRKIKVIHFLREDV